MDSQLKGTPYSVTIRRNPYRKARLTPATSDAPDPSTSSRTLPINDIPPFPIQDLDPPSPPKCSEPISTSETLKVFLRIRPFLVSPVGKKITATRGNASSKLRAIHEKKNNKKASTKKNVCLFVNDSRSVTIATPPSMIDAKRSKTETYEGFAHIFSHDSLQKEVYKRVMDPLVTDFMGGKSGLLAAMGPTGSGKTHTIFGTMREPGIVPLALHHIFSNCSTSGASEFPRSYYLSMFEIYSERGKGERIFDLSPDGGELCLQQSTVKGLQELIFSDVTEAECFIARGMLKRTTAITNANSKSSRSQCIINIRHASTMADNEDQILAGNAILTIVDLAGAEREKRTGNQGLRLLESNFINNTSMVLGLCLRSLLEHQKNPTKPLQKHFQNSLLTRYLRDYLEGKKRMTLILTVKPGEDDYLDTSLLLRQASPYMKIKFNSVEELPRLKRHIPTTRKEIPKRRKCNDLEASMIEGRNAKDGHLTPEQETISVQLQEHEPLPVLVSSPLVKAEMYECIPPNGDYYVQSQREERNDQVMRDFSKALWNVLKQYKKKLEVSENEVRILRECLTKEKSRVLALEEELKNSFHTQPLSEAPSCPELNDAAAFGSTGLLGSARKLSKNAHEASEENCRPQENGANPSVESACCPDLKASQHKIIEKIETSDTVVIDSSLSTDSTQDFQMQPCGKIDSYLGTKHVTGDLKAPKHLEVDDVLSISDVSAHPFEEVVIDSSSSSEEYIQRRSFQIICDDAENLEGLEHGKAEDVSSITDPKVAIDSGFSTEEDFKRQFYQNVECIPGTKLADGDLIGVKSLEINAISSIIDETGAVDSFFSTQANSEGQSYLNDDIYLESKQGAHNLEGVKRLEADNISSITDTAVAIHSSFPTKEDPKGQCYQIKNDDAENLEGLEHGKAKDVSSITGPKVAIDSGFFTEEDFKRQFYQNVDSIPGTKLADGDLIGVKSLEINAISSIIDETGGVDSFFSTQANSEGQSYLNDDIYLESKQGAHNLEGVKRLEADNISSITDTAVVIHSSFCTKEDPKSQCYQNVGSHPGAKLDAGELIVPKHLEVDDVKIGDVLSISDVTVAIDSISSTKEGCQCQRFQVLDLHVSSNEDTECIERNAGEVPQTAEKHVSFPKKDAGKPRRRLLPSSCILVKEIGGFDMEENTKSKGEKKATVLQQGRAQSGDSLLRLLRNIGQI